MARNGYSQYVWLVDVIRSAGQISKHEIDALWEKSALNTKHEKSYPIRSFHRHRNAIYEVFGLYIGCDRDTNNYYISNVEDLRSYSIHSRICNTLAFSNTLYESTELQKRVFFEDTKDGMSLLPVILDAMREKRALQLVFFPEKNKFSIKVVPYCIKEHHHMWYLAAKPTIDSENTEVQVYNLSELMQVNKLKEKASMPRWFKGDVFFEAFFEHTEAPKKKAKTEVKKDSTPKIAEKKVKKADTIAPAKHIPEQTSLF